MERVFVQDEGFVHRHRRVQRREQRRGARNALQRIHPVGDRRPVLVGTGVGEVHPTRPAGPALRHQPGVGMQHEPVSPKRDPAEYAPFARRGVLEERERRVGMAREHDRIEPFGFLADRLDAHPVRPACHRLHRGARAHLRAHVRGHLRNVAPGTALDRPPLMMAGERKQPVIVEKPCQDGGGKVHHPRARRRPDGAAHGQQVVAREPGSEPPAPDHVAQRQARAFRGVGQRRAVEHRDVAEHAPERRPDRVRRLRQHGPEAAAPVFDRPAVDGDRERHAALAHGHAEMLEEAAKVGIVHAVEHDEAGVDGHLPAAGPDHEGPRVTAQPVRRLEQHHIVGARKEPRGAEAGNARPHDRYPATAARRVCSLRFHPAENTQQTLRRITPRQQPVAKVPRAPRPARHPQGGLTPHAAGLLPQTARDL